MATPSTFEYGSSDGYRLHRITYLPRAESVLVGPMAASPHGSGVRARFSDLRTTPLNGDDEKAS